MSALRPYRRGFAVATVTILLILPLIAGCDLLGGPKEPPQEVTQEQTSSFGPCLPSYGSKVFAASMNRAGNRALYLTGAKPPTLPDDASWGSNDRAIMVMDGDVTVQSATPPATGEASGVTLRSIAVTWDPMEEIPPYPTMEFATQEAEPYPLPEQMQYLELAATGNRFVVAVSRDGVEGTFAKLYTGMVPDSGSTELKPGEGLALVPLNRYDATQGLQSFALADDGSRVAAVVGGSPGEVRVYDFNEEKPYVYSLGPKGQIVVQHDLPPVDTSISEPRQPAIASNGVIRLVWAPTSDRLALSADVGVGDAVLYILDVQTGKLALVRRFRNSTAPWMAWSKDGRSLIAMNTPLNGPVVFGDTELRRIEAVENGKDVGSGVTLHRPPGWRTAPAYLVSLGESLRYVFMWEGRLFRLDTPGSDLTLTSFQELTLAPPAMLVTSGYPSVSGASDTAMFVVADDLGNTYVGARTHLSAETCPEAGVPTNAPAGTGTSEAGQPTGEPQATEPTAKSTSGATSAGEATTAPAAGTSAPAAGSTGAPGESTSPAGAAGTAAPAKATSQPAATATGG